MKFLTVQFNDITVAIPLEQVSAVLRASDYPISEVPGASPGVLGMIYRHDCAITVRSLSYAYQLPECNVEAFILIFVKDVVVALAVQAYGNVVDVDQSEIQPTITGGQCFIHEQDVIGILRLDRDFFEL